MKGRSKRADGGGVQKGVKANNAAPTEVYAGAGSNVVKEAKAKAISPKSATPSGQVTSATATDRRSQLEAAFDAQAGGRV